MIRLQEWWARCLGQAATGRVDPELSRENLAAAARELSSWLEAERARRQLARDLMESAQFWMDLREQHVGVGADELARWYSMPAEEDR